MRIRKRDLVRSDIFPAVLGILFWLIMLIGFPLLIVLLRHR
jgi:hypothetical protein